MYGFTQCFECSVRVLCMQFLKSTEHTTYCPTHRHRQKKKRRRRRSLLLLLSSLLLQTDVWLYRTTPPVQRTERNRVDGTAQRRPLRGRQHRFQRRVPRPRRAERRERARRARLVAAPRALRASPLGLTLLGECTGRTQQGSRPPPLAGPPARVPTLPIARRPFLTPLFSVLSPVTSAPHPPPLQASKVAP